MQINDPKLTKLLDANIAEQEDVVQVYERSLAEQDKFIDELCNSQMKREDVAILSMENRLEEMMEESESMTSNYKVTQNLANNGDQNAKGRLAELRAEITEFELSNKSLEAQLRLLKEQNLNQTKDRFLGTFLLPFASRGLPLAKLLP